MRVACENIIEHDDWLFCYAYVAGQGPLNGTRIMHAWNEKKEWDIVFDFSNGRTIVKDKKRYYENAKIQEKDITRQNYKEVMELIFKHRTYGGWVKGPMQIPMKI